MTRTLSRWQAVVLGLVILTGLVLGAVALFAVGSRQWVLDGFTVRAKVPDVSGVVAGTRVLVKGQDAGEVEQVEMPADPEGEFVLHLRIAGKVRHLVREDSTIQIVDENLFGGKVVLIANGSASKPIVQDYAFLGTQPTGALSDHLVQATQKLMTGDGPLAKTNKDIQDATGRLNKILTQAEQVVGDLNAGKGTLGKLLKDDELHAELTRTLKDVNVVVTELQEGKGTLGKLLKDEKLYGDLTKTLDQVNVLVMDVQEGKGTLGKLLKNTELYVEALQSLKELQTTMASFKQNADAIKSLPVISSYVVDVNKELNRPGAKRHRIHFATHKLFDGDTSILSANGRKTLDAAAEWLNDRKDEGSEIVVASFADPKKHAPDFAATLTQKQSEAVVDYLKNNHKVQRMGFWWWSNRRVVALGCGTTPTPVPESEKLPAGRVELIVFVPVQ